MVRQGGIVVVEQETGEERRGQVMAYLMAVKAHREREREKGRKGVTVAQPYPSREDQQCAREGERERGGRKGQERNSS